MLIVLTLSVIMYEHEMFGVAGMQGHPGGG